MPIQLLSLYLKWLSLLTPTSGINKSQEAAIDTDLVARRAMKQLLTSAIKNEEQH